MTKRSFSRDSAGAFAIVAALAPLFVGCLETSFDAAPRATPSAVAPAVTFDAVKGWIEEGSVGSVGELLSRLPESFRSRYVLMFRSRSLQPASFESPRAILYGSDAKFVLAFSGAHDALGSNVVETMQFDDETDRFRFREITFSPLDETGGQGKAVVSEVNPEQCVVCHGAPARPLWDAYPSWPGAYGEHEHQPLGALERKGLDGFLRNRMGSPRYLSLLGAESLAKTEVSAAESIENTYEGLANRPSSNAWFGLLLSRLNFRAIARQVAETREFSRYAYSLLAALERQCGDVSLLLPPDAPSSSEDGTGSSVAAEDALSRFRRVVEVSLGLSTRGWTLTLEKDSPDFTTIRPTVGTLEVALLDVVSKTDPRVRSLYAVRGQSDEYCSYLMKRRAVR
jgi:hypothetical protein